MKQQCFVCKKWYSRLVQHLQRSKKCLEKARKNNVSEVSLNMDMKPLSQASQDENKDYRGSNFDMVGRDGVLERNEDLEIMDGEQSLDDVVGNLSDDWNDDIVHNASRDINNEMDSYELLQNDIVKHNVAVGRNAEINIRHIEEYILQGIEDEICDNYNEDYDVEENVSNGINEDMGMDPLNTPQSASSFAQLPDISNNEFGVDGQVMLSKEVTAVNGMEETTNNTILYAPLLNMSL